ncbi:hypothetical protein EV699_106139 [Plasticicumulans lactativorans]|uniref:Uncharacterized protein n=1 Tax=Plasticicumulans lactativorans TaxID=1133106 RepID=A0A4R2LGE6_9GAMM|nr:hypothetical protein [Plasticicumulans lactativorans]TCO82044.1 hypothetical protein EV699_106139 [Plasticicumulans lactativorans]
MLLPAVYWDAQDERLLYLLAPADDGTGPKQPRLVVALDYREKKAGTINAVRSAFLTDPLILESAPRYDRIR